MAACFVYIKELVWGLPFHHVSLGRVLEVISVEEELNKEKWSVPDEEEDHEEFWGFEDLEN